jgi:hypothetical protein
MTEDDLRPARPSRPRETPAPEPAAPEEAPEAPEAPAAAPADDEALALERGRTAAVVAALGRMQMSIDILSRKVAALEAAVRERG